VYVTSKNTDHSDQVAEKRLNQNYNPVGLNEVWAGDFSYCGEFMLSKNYSNPLYWCGV
jgi:hypothetical protein